MGNARPGRRPRTKGGPLSAPASNTCGSSAEACSSDRPPRLATGAAPRPPPQGPAAAEVLLLCPLPRPMAAGTVAPLPPTLAPTAPPPRLRRPAAAAIDPLPPVGGPAPGPAAGVEEPPPLTPMAPVPPPVLAVVARLGAPPPACAPPMGVLFLSASAAATAVAQAVEAPPLARAEANRPGGAASPSRA